MQGVPWWGVVSSAAAPVLMVGGWTAAADLQPRFDPVSETVSSLAAPGATDRWVMTLTFVVVGLCYVVTALALRPARTVAAAAVTVQLALVAWFAVELVTGAGQTGLAERIAGAAQALWPLAVVLACEVAPGRSWRTLAD